MQAMKRCCVHVAWLTLLLNGCAGLAPTALTTEYVCAGGGGFKLTTRGDVAEIELNRMLFGLTLEASPDGTSVYSCSMLAVTRRDDMARVELEGQSYLEQCRPKAGKGSNHE